MSPQTQAGASFGIASISAILAGLGEQKEGSEQSAAFNYNADITLQNMQSDEIANEQRYSQLVGKQAAAYAASGVDITRGSPLLMMAATAGRGGRQAEAIYEAGTEEATLQRYYGKLAAWRGTVGGVGTFLKGITDASQAYLDATGYSGGNNDPGSIPTDSNGNYITLK